MEPSIKCRFLPSGWNKASLSLDASEEHDGYSSAEDPLNSDAEDDNGKTLVRVTFNDFSSDFKVTDKFSSYSCFYSVTKNSVTC